MDGPPEYPGVWGNIELLSSFPAGSFRTLSLVVPSKDNDVLLITSFSAGFHSKNKFVY